MECPLLVLEENCTTGRIGKETLRRIYMCNADSAAEMPKVKCLDQDANFSKLSSAFTSSCP